MRKRLYFDGAPDRFSRTKALFAETSRLRVRYPASVGPESPPRRDTSRPQRGSVPPMMLLKTGQAWLMNIVWGG